VILTVSHLRGAVQHRHRNSRNSVILIKCTVTVISAFLSYLTVRVGFIITEVIRAFQATRRWPISIPKDVCNESSSTSRQKR
jgi:hypothetical protein